MLDRSAQMFLPAVRLCATGFLTSLEETEGVKAIGRPNRASRRRPADMPPSQRNRPRTDTHKGPPVQRNASSSDLVHPCRASELSAQYVISEARAGRILPQPFARSVCLITIRCNTADQRTNGAEYIGFVPDSRSIPDRDPLPRRAAGARTRAARSAATRSPHVRNGFDDQAAIRQSLSSVQRVAPVATPAGYDALSCFPVDGNQHFAMAMHRPRNGRFWRKFAAGLAAYSIALQLALSGLALAMPIGQSAAAVAICSEHAADSSEL